ncbi:DUF483 domain-containing protein [Candidatus Woesearchaeota archaeon]|nr:DUF483 domain-containing protein [Candidatus Woesearchaeota archaeon]
MMIENLFKIFGTKTKALEILYLLEDVKPVVRQGFYHNEIRKITDFCKEKGLYIEFSPYKIVLMDHGAYSNKGIKVDADDPREGMVFAYISKGKEKAKKANFHEANNNHINLGKALGYPECCCRFFKKHEPERSRLDSDYTVCTAENSGGSEFPFYTNILKRSMDITLLNHFPCSFNCENSIKLAKNHLDIIKKHDPEMADYFSERLKGKFNIEERLFEFI